MALEIAPGEISCEIVPDRERVIVVLAGELDVATAPQVRKTLDEILPAGFAGVVVDLSRLTFIDSTGLHLLVTADRTAREHDCRLTLVPGGPAVQRAFEVSGLESAFAFEARRRG